MLYRFTGRILGTVAHVPCILGLAWLVWLSWLCLVGLAWPGLAGLGCSDCHGLLGLGCCLALVRCHISVLDMATYVLRGMLWYREDGAWGCMDGGGHRVCGYKERSENWGIGVWVRSDWACSSVSLARGDLYFTHTNDRGHLIIGLTPTAKVSCSCLPQMQN